MFKREMDSSLGFQLKTKFDAFENTLVFTTNKTLNERFSRNAPRTTFVLNNGYTAPHENNQVAGRVVFENRRNMDTHKRFTLYQRGNLIEIEKQVFGSEDIEKLKLDLDKIGSKRRTVFILDDVDNEEAKFCSKEAEKTTDIRSDYNLIAPSSAYVNIPRNSRSSKRIKIEQLNDKVEKIKKCLNKCKKMPVKRTLDRRVKGEVGSSDGNNLKNSEGSEPIIYSPYPSYKTNYYGNKSLYKWKRGPTKEELDEELDSYMAEAKGKVGSMTPVKEDVDSFVQEYMLETEKCLNETEDVEMLT